MEKINDEQNLYEILGVLPTATLQEIKKAYKQRAMEYHPDINPEVNNELCHQIMCKINEAYSILRDTESRKTYDEMLKSISQYHSSNDEAGCEEEAGTSDDEASCEEEACTSDDESGNSTREYQKTFVDEDLYEYYNSVDFDENMQDMFINWMEDFADSYIRYVYDYYHRLAINENEILEELYSLFENNINVEKNFTRKRGRTLKLR